VCLCMHVCVCLCAHVCVCVCERMRACARVVCGWVGDRRDLINLVVKNVFTKLDINNVPKFFQEHGTVQSVDF
jgi:hypothetical protein